jgi:hypothetical protein
MSSFRLNAFVLFGDTVFLPSMLSALPFIVTIKSTWLQRVLTDASIPFLLGAPALMLLVRTLLFLYTVVFDRRIELRGEVLHVPITGALQLRPLDVPLDRIASAHSERRSVVLLMKGGGKLSFNAAPLAGERYAFFEKLRGRLDR